MSEVVLSLLGALISLLGGVITNLLPNYSKDAIRRLVGLSQKKQEETYSEKIARLTDSLSKATAEVDDMINEIAVVSRERTKTVTELEKHLEELNTREKQVEKRIEVLEKVPLEAVQQFERILDKGEKRSAWRDYLLFGLGVIVSTTIAIVLKLIGF